MFQRISFRTFKKSPLYQKQYKRRQKKKNYSTVYHPRVPTFTTHCIVFTFKRSAQNSLLALFSLCFSQAMLTKNKNIYIHIYSENRGTHTYLEIYRASIFNTRIKANVSVNFCCAHGEFVICLPPHPPLSTVQWGISYRDPRQMNRREFGLTFNFICRTNQK